MGILENLTITSVGRLSHDTPQLRKWVEANSGCWAARPGPGVTHVLASKEAWKKHRGKAKSEGEGEGEGEGKSKDKKEKGGGEAGEISVALAVGAVVVSYDWLEDSLQRRRRLSEKKYSWAHLMEQRRMRREVARVGARYDSKKFLEGCDEAQRCIGSGTSMPHPPRKCQRKPRASRGFFFRPDAVVEMTLFVSAAEELRRRRAKRAGREKGSSASASCAGAVNDEDQVEDEDDKGNENERNDENETVTPSPRQHNSTNSSPSPSHSAQEIPSPSPFTSASVSSPSAEAAALTTDASTSSPAPSAHPTLPTTRARSEAKKPSLKDAYHFYVDNTGFEYKTVLFRSNYHTNSMARYRVSILESHAKPHVYCTFVEYAPPAVGAQQHMQQQQQQQRSETEMKDALARFNKTAVPPTPQRSATPPPPPTTTADAKAAAEAAAAALKAATATQLSSFLYPPTPGPTTPYKTLVVPHGSAFPPAWRAFRHVFRDLTLLSWEERFDECKRLQKERALHFGVEPFLYAKPKPGMPVGLRTQDATLFRAQTLCRREQGDVDVGASEQHLEGESTEESALPNDDGYIFNRYGLPGLSQPLGREGAVGSAVFKESKEQRAIEAKAAMAAVKGRAQMAATAGCGGRGGGAIAKSRAKKYDWRYKMVFDRVTGLTDVRR